MESANIGPLASKMLSIPSIIRSNIQTIAQAQGSSDDFQVSSDPNFLPQNEPSIAIDPLNPSDIAAGANDYKLVASGGDAWAGVYTSSDAGKTWTNSLIPGFPGDSTTNVLTGFGAASDPGLAFDAKGNAYYSGIVFNRINGVAVDGTLFVSKSTDQGHTWSQTVIVSRGSGTSPFDDKPYLTVDRSTGTVYVSWTMFTTSHRSTTGAIEISKSTDGGLTWSSPITLSNSASNQGSIPAATNGIVYDVWYDLTGNTLKIARSSNGGTFTSPQVVTSVAPLPNPSPNSLFRTNSFPTLSVDPSNSSRLSIAWADFGTGHGIILDTTSTDGTATWTTPVKVNDDNTMNDHFFPWLTIDTGIIHVIFYDRREDPANHNMDIFYSESSDWGKTFRANMRLSDVSSNPDVGFSGQFIGDYTGLAAYGGQVHAVWMDTRNAVIGTSTGSNQDIYTEAFNITKNIKILSVTPLRTVAYTRATVNPVTINVTVQNQGNLTITVTVTGFANMSSIGTSMSKVGPGQNTILTLLWNTTLIPLGNYNISAQAKPLPGETTFADNAGTGGMVQVRKAGDVDGDGSVDINDLIQVYVHEFTSNPLYDINNDGSIDITDLIITWQHQFT